MTKLSFSQLSLVTIPDSLSKDLKYYSPTYRVKTKAAFRGTLKIEQPFDSLDYGEGSLLTPLSPWETKDLNNLERSVLIIWDSTQEWECFEIMTSPKGKNKFTPAKYVPIYRDGAEINGNKVKRVGYKGMPVYILNNTDSNFLVSFPKFGMRIFQEAQDKQGQWRRIEESYSLPKDVSSDGYHRVIRPGQYILATVFKYKGDYQTLLRLCLETLGQKLYSQPFSGSINYSQFGK